MDESPPPSRRRRPRLRSRASTSPRANFFAPNPPARARARARARPRASRVVVSRAPARGFRKAARARSAGRARDRSIVRSRDPGVVDHRSRANLTSSIARVARVRDPIARSRKSFPSSRIGFSFFFRAARISRISPRSTYCAFEKRRARDRASRGRSIGARDRAIESLAARGCLGARSRARSRMGFHTSAHCAAATRRAARAFATRRVARCSRARPSRAARASRCRRRRRRGRTATTATVDARRDRDRRRGRRTTRTIRRRRSRRTSRETSCSREASAREDGNRCGRA